MRRGNEQTFLREDKQIVNINVKNCSVSLIVRENPSQGKDKISHTCENGIHPKQ